MGYYNYYTTATWPLDRTSYTPTLFPCPELSRNRVRGEVCWESEYKSVMSFCVEKGVGEPVLRFVNLEDWGLIPVDGSREVSATVYTKNKRYRREGVLIIWGNPYDMVQRSERLPWQKKTAVKIVFQI